MWMHMDGMRPFAGDTPASSSQGSQGSGRRGGLPLDGDYPRCLSRVRHNVYRIR